MKQFFKGAKPHHYAIWSVLIATTLLAIFTPDILIFKAFAKFGVQVMFVCLISGLLFLVFKDPRSMYISFACCTILCLHLRTRLPFYPTPTGDPFKIAHINLSNSQDYEKTIEAILQTNADVIAFQEITPDWEILLKERLEEKYPNQQTYLSLGVFSPGIFSKEPLLEMDTFQYKNAPNLHGVVEMNNRNIHFISSMTVPPVNSEAYQQIRNHLLKIGEFAKKLEAPVLALGDYNVVNYSDEMTGLRTRGELKDSRRDVSIVAQSPVDHILYSEHLECIGFETITDNGTTGNRLGIIGTYQINQAYYAQKRIEKRAEKAGK